MEETPTVGGMFHSMAVLITGVRDNMTPKYLPSRNAAYVLLMLIALADFLSNAPLDGSDTKCYRNPVYTVHFLLCSELVSPD